MSRMIIATLLTVAALAVLALAAATLASSPADASPLYASPTPVVTGPGTQDAPSQGRNNWPLAWEDDVSGFWRVALALPTETAAASTAGGVQRHPAVEGNRLVYEDDRNGTWDLYTTQVTLLYYPVPSQVDAPFATGSGDQLDPAVSGDTVVYESNVAGDWDICARSLSTGVERRLTTGGGDQVDPAIDRNNVVFADHRNGNWDIYRYDLTTGKTTRLTTDRAAQRAPQIRHGVVVYQDHRNGNWDIYAYTLGSGKEHRLTTEPHDQTAPSIATERTVVYEDNRSGVPDIYLCDLATGMNKPVTDDPAAQTQPTVGYTFVAWTDARGGDDDIYGCTLDYPHFTLGGPGDSPAYGSSVEVGGQLLFASDAPAAATIRMQGAGLPNAVPVEWAPDGSTGSYSCTFRAVRKVTVTAAYRGDANHLPSTVQKVTILPRAALSTPAVKRRFVPNTQAYVHSLSASGTLKPRHTAGTKAVTLQVWRLGLTGNWTLFKSVKVPVRTVNGASVYSAKVLPAMSMGYRYRVCAVHADADHARTTSAFSRAVGGL